MNTSNLAEDVTSARAFVIPSPAVQAIRLLMAGRAPIKINKDEVAQAAINELKPELLAATLKLI